MANQQKDQNMNVNQKPAGSQTNESSTAKNPAGKRAEDSKLNIQDATKQKQVDSPELNDIE